MRLQFFKYLRVVLAALVLCLAASSVVHALDPLKELNERARVDDSKLKKPQDCLADVAFEDRRTVESKKLDSVYVGFWEKQGIRQAFKFKNGEWKSTAVPIDSQEDYKAVPKLYDEPSNWNIFFDGASRGKLSTRAFDCYNYSSQVGLVRITTKNLPKIRARKIDLRFSGFSTEEKFRPILVTSYEKPSDPSKWKRVKPERASSELLSDFKERIKDKVSFCVDGDCKEKHLRAINDSEVMIQDTFMDKSGRKLISLKLNFKPKTNVYCEIVDDRCAQEMAFWYLQKGSGKPKFLVPAASLVEAADLNNDGESEFLFWITNYNLDGYRLVDGKSLKQFETSWSFH